MHSHRPHHYWLAWGHQGSPSSPLPILAAQRGSHHQGWSSPAKWSTHHASCWKGKSPASTASIPSRNNEVIVAHVWKFLLAQHQQAHRRSSPPVWNLHPISESECCSASHTYIHTIMPMTDVCHRYLPARRSWPPGCGQLLLKDDLHLMSSTQPEQCQQGCLAAERDVFRAWHPQSPSLWQWPTICECPVHWLLYILGHNTWNLMSTLPTIQWSCWGMHQVCQTCNPMSQIQQFWSTACLASTLDLHPLTPSFHPQQSYCTSTNSEQPSQPRYTTMAHQPYKSLSRSTHAQKLPNHRLTNAAKHLHHCMLVNQLQCMTPSEGFGFLVLWYTSYHGTAIKYAPAMVLHTAKHGDTFMNAVSKQSTLSQVTQLPHHRLQLDTASQWHNLHCPYMHSACSHTHCTCHSGNTDEPGSTCSHHTSCSNACHIPCHTCVAIKIQPCLHGTKMPDPGNLGTNDPDCPWTLLL